MKQATERHLEAGVLRRLLDEPQATPAADRTHFDNCADCRSALREMATASRQTAHLLGAEMSVDAAAALGAVRARTMARQRRFRRSGAAPPAMFRRRRGALIASTVTGGAVLAAALTAAGYGALAVFTPQRIAPVQVAPSELRGLPDLAAFGRETLPAPPHPRRVADAGAAQAVSGLALSPPTLPDSVRDRAASFYVIDPVNGTFTFDAARAQATAASRRASLPPMPAGVDGSTISVALGPAVVQMYGGNLGSLYGERGAETLPQLVIGEVRAPRVRVAGATLAQIEDYLLAMPGISASLSAQIRSIGDPSSSLPIPVPLGSGHPVSINGSPGVALGDATGVGSAVIWERAGTVRAVGGTLSEEDVLAVARSLH